MATMVIDNLITNAIRCAERKGFEFGISIVTAKDTNKGMIGDEPYYHLTNGKGGGVYMRCKDTNVRNILFHIHFFVVGRKIESFSEPYDFWGAIKN